MGSWTDIIMRDVNEQMMTEGRPLETYILTPTQFRELADELRTSRRSGHDHLHETEEIVMYVPGQDQPVRIIRGSE